MAEILRERKDIPDEYKWDLSAIYENEDLWHEDFEKAKELMEKLPSYEGHLTESSDTLHNYIRESEELDLIIDDLFVYAKMRLDEDNRVSVYQGMRDKVMALAVRIGELTAFVVPELMAAGEEKVLGLARESEELQIYELSFKRMFRYAPYTLSQKEEALLAAVGEVAEAPSKVFDMFNDADIVFPEITDEDGTEIRITHGNYIRLMESKNRETRKAAYHGLYSVYRSYKNTVAAMLCGNVKAECFSASVRHYPSARFAAMYGDAVDESLYDGLIKAIRENLDAFGDYLDLRKQVLGVDELHFYDLYTPLVAEADRKIPYDEGFDIVKKAMAPLGEEYVALLQRARDERWMDVYENVGKTSGAYSWGVDNAHPYVLMSYDDNLNSVSTMAHELGHSLHSWYSWNNQPRPYSHYRIFVAEVASTVNETLLCDYLLKHSRDDKEKAFLLNQYLEEFRGTVYRQTMFAEFEKIIHQRSENMETLTADDFCDIYLQLNKNYFGDKVVYDEDIAMEWARIPHFYNGFYVYKYATSFAAAQYLANRILNKESGAVDAYIDFLKSGCSDDPNELLKKAGVDLTDPDTIPGIFSIFRNRLCELRELMEA